MQWRSQIRAHTGLGPGINISNNFYLVTNGLNYVTLPRGSDSDDAGMDSMAANRRPSSQRTLFDWVQRGKQMRTEETQESGEAHEDSNSESTDSEQVESLETTPTVPKRARFVDSDSSLYSTPTSDSSSEHHVTALFSPEVPV